MGIINRLATDKKGFESGDIYIKDAVAYWSVVYEPKTKLKSTDKEYAITLFVDSDDRKILEEDLLFNKTFFEVGRDKNKFKQVKFKTSKQASEDEFNYDSVEGLHGAQFTCAEFNKKGKKNVIAVYGPDGEKFDEDIGNGSKVLVKLFCYRNQEGMLNTMLKAVKVLEHVPYSSGGSGEVFDDVMNVTINTKPAEEDFGDVDDSVPFEVEDDSDLY